MITTLEIKNFKCFEHVQVQLAGMTLLTGFNASGKSSLLQALLLLTQTLRAKEQTDFLQVNGSLVNLGSPADILNQHQQGSEIELGIQGDSSRLKWFAKATEKDEKRTLRIDRVQVEGPDGKRDSSDRLLSLLPADLKNDSLCALVGSLRELVYLSAVRRVETDIYPVPEDPSPTPGNVGSRGEFAPWLLHYFDDMTIEAAKCIGESTAKTLRAQTNAWLSELFPGAEANAQPIQKTRFMRLELRTRPTDDWRRPSNIGYGLGYAFPVVMAGLLAKTGQILIIDSPEAHLHPRGQSRMGRFLAQVAAAGVQLLVETHSDHLLNGLRLAIKEKVVSPQQVAVYFFTNDAAHLTSIHIDAEGNLSNWPSGFFDQSEQDLSTLAGWS